MSYRGSPPTSELRASIARLDAATDRIRSNPDAESPHAQEFTSKLTKFSSQVTDLDRTVDDLCSSINVEREIAAAKALREEKAAIKKQMYEAEEAADRKYKEAISLAKLEAEAVEQTLRSRRAEEDKLDRLREEMEVRRKAREQAERVYSTDLTATMRRLREMELELERTRTGVSTAYERRRLHDSLRRIRLSRFSLGELTMDYDYHGRRLAASLDAPSLYTGLASRAYDMYPYYRNTRSYYPYSTPYYSSSYASNSHYGYPSYSSYSRYYAPMV
eukprot:m.414591 g.414591  ORF g.414591 m.414591 type:complete len:275 (-) comp29377_c0_seq1:70-894(-)